MIFVLYNNTSTLPAFTLKKDMKKMHASSAKHYEMTFWISDFCIHSYNPAPLFTNQRIDKLEG
jgi:hypothetical protein